MRTVKGNKIEGAGVTPDRVVPLSLADLRDGRDAVLEEAERLLRDRAVDGSRVRARR